jgi:hypothetical protein
VVEFFSSSVSAATAAPPLAVASVEPPLATQTTPPQPPCSNAPSRPLASTATARSARTAAVFFAPEQRAAVVASPWTGHSWAPPSSPRAPTWSLWAPQRFSRLNLVANSPGACFHGSPSPPVRHSRR